MRKSLIVLGLCLMIAGCKEKTLTTRFLNEEIEDSSIEEDVTAVVDYCTEQELFGEAVIVEITPDDAYRNVKFRLGKKEYVATYKSGFDSKDVIDAFKELGLESEVTDQYSYYNNDWCYARAIVDGETVMVEINKEGEPRIIENIITSKVEVTDAEKVLVDDYMKNVFLVGEGSIDYTYYNPAKGHGVIEFTYNDATHHRFNFNVAAEEWTGVVPDPIDYASVYPNAEPIEGVEAKNASDISGEELLEIIPNWDDIAIVIGFEGDEIKCIDTDGYYTFVYPIHDE